MKAWYSEHSNFLYLEDLPGHNQLLYMYIDVQVKCALYVPIALQTVSHYLKILFIYLFL